MKSQSPQKAADISTFRDIEVIAKIVSIGKLADMPLDHALPRLIAYLSERSDFVADHALQAVKKMVPMAALEERWSDSRKLPAEHPHIPLWIRESCRGWQTANDIHSHLTSHLNEALQNGLGEQFLQRVTLLPGIRRSFPLHLKNHGLADEASLFEQLSMSNRQGRFPIQIGVSPTMDCQLHCNYCISAGNHGGENMSEGAFSELLAWAKINKVRRIGFSGGEPTLFPHFPRLLERVKEHDLEWYIASNGLIPPPLLQTITLHQPLSVTLHLTPEVLNNRKLLDTFRASARFFTQNGTYTVLRCNFFDQDLDISPYLDQAVECGIREVRAAVPMPNAYQHNSYIATDDLHGFARLLDEYFIQGTRRGLNIILAKPFPICLLSKQCAQYFLANDSLAYNCSVHISDGTNNLVVNPDMQPMPCLGVNIKQDTKITTFASLKEVGDSYQRILHDLMKKPLLANCNHCPLALGGRCIGACLSYRLSSTDSI